jgi:hypothetical protein
LIEGKASIYYHVKGKIQEEEDRVSNRQKYAAKDVNPPLPALGYHITPFSLMA